ncbi:MAG: hypothetical protein FWE14_04885 [Lachnospiraceae bacterium]|nr:hypothetical protein [Lachnospiraceae bacterium]
MAKNFTMKANNGAGWDTLHPKTSMGQVEGLSPKINEVEAIAKGAAPSTHNHTRSQITDFPASLPSSDVPAWAKAANKPTYTAAEVGAATSNHTHTAENVGAAASNHTHTAANVGAAAANHTHTAANVGAAPSTHSHGAGDLNVPVITVGRTTPAGPKVGDIWYDENN